MSLRTKAVQVLEELSKRNPAPRTELMHSNPFELLVATILSAQCTDERVNMVTPYLFEKYPTASSLASATVEEVMDVIKSINFFKTKAKHLVAMAAILVEDFHEEVPEQRKGLESLPGVGRKTANVVLANAFDEPALAVDTHVHRVSNRLGLVDTKTPEQTERALNVIIPKKMWIDAHHLLILHGRYICKARKPECVTCPVRSCCDYKEKSS